MGNFIEDLDKWYENERQTNGIKDSCNIPLTVELYGNVSRNYMIRKKKFTKFLFTKDDCRVYFSDTDILMMLLQVHKTDTMDLLMDYLVKAYWNNVEKYYIHIGNEKYEVDGIPQIEDNQILTNSQDIDITFNELYVLVNLILAKDRASNPLWPYGPDFFRHTISKYISLIKYYHYKDTKAKTYLENMGYDVKVDIYSNYDTAAKRSEKRKFFSDFKTFEKSGVL